MPDHMSVNHCLQPTVTTVGLYCMFKIYRVIDVKQNIYFFKSVVHARNDIIGFDAISRRKISKLCPPPVSWYPPRPLKWHEIAI